MERPEDLAPYRELIPAKPGPLLEGKRSPRVTFINPGRRDEAFWNMVSHFMKAVVEDIPIELEILNAERDHLMMKDMVKVVCAREPKPDYLILVNEKDTGEVMLRMAERAGVKSFLLLNPLGKAAAASLGAPRERLKSWVGALIVDQERAGYDIARTLLASGEQISVNASTLELKGEDGETSGFMLILSDISAEKRVRSTMARYMPKEVIEQLLQSEQRAQVGAAQVVTTLFSDIRGFTTISEAIGATATVALLNEYFTEMLEVLESHHGILDKYIGDAVMAIFGAPFTGAQDADNAVRAANGMILALEALNERRAARGQARLDIGVGLNTGEVVLGNIGSPKRMDYTVIGDPVNLAARLEGVTKLYGARIVLSQFTYEQLKERAGIRELDLIRVKGKTEPVAIYESFAYKLGEVDEAFHQSIDEYNAGLAAYRAQAWAQSQAHFTNALALNPQDKASSLYLERIASYDAQMPAESWDGVFNLDTK